MSDLERLGDRHLRTALATLAVSTISEPIRWVGRVRILHCRRPTKNTPKKNKDANGCEAGRYSHTFAVPDRRCRIITNLPSSRVASNACGMINVNRQVTNLSKRKADSIHVHTCKHDRPPQGCFNHIVQTLTIWQGFFPAYPVFKLFRVRYKLLDLS